MLRFFICQFKGLIAKIVYTIPNFYVYFIFLVSHVSRNLPGTGDELATVSLLCMLGLQLLWCMPEVYLRISPSCAIVAHRRENIAIAVVALPVIRDLRDLYIILPATVLKPSPFTPHKLGEHMDSVNKPVLH